MLCADPTGNVLRVVSLPDSVRRNFLLTTFREAVSLWHRLRLTQAPGCAELPAWPPIVAFDSMVICEKFVNSGEIKRARSINVCLWAALCQAHTLSFLC